MQNLLNVETKLGIPEFVGVGVLDDPEIRLTEYGEIAQNCIKEMNDIYENIEIEKYVIMPNHIHFLISIINGSSGTPTPTTLLRTHLLFSVHTVMKYVPICE